jgi:putative FmdB family regulatory protein
MLSEPGHKYERRRDMPLYDYLCEDCGNVSELLVNVSFKKVQCAVCGSSNLKKLMSAHSSLSGTHQMRLPGAGDTGCCGSQPHQANCEGPGSCCGRATRD